MQATKAVRVKSSHTSAASAAGRKPALLQSFRPVLQVLPAQRRYLPETLEGVSSIMSLVYAVCFCRARYDLEIGILTAGSPKL